MKLHLKINRHLQILPVLAHPHQPIIIFRREGDLGRHCWRVRGQARGELLEKPPPPNPAPGTEDSASQKTSPPSPWKLGEMTTAAFSFARKESERPIPPDDPELHPEHQAPPPSARNCSDHLNRPRRGERLPPADYSLRRAWPSQSQIFQAHLQTGKSPLRPAGLLARRSRLVSANRCAIESKRGRTSREAPFSTILPSNLPLSFSMSFVPPSKYTTLRRQRLFQTGRPGIRIADEGNGLRLDYLR